ncbi:MAG: hypothetical protein ACKVPX_17880 [Myxococcaceae bacterium]
MSDAEVLKRFLELNKAVRSGPQNGPHDVPLRHQWRRGEAQILFDRIAQEVSPAAAAALRAQLEMAPQSVEAAAVLAFRVGCVVGARAEQEWLRCAHSLYADEYVRAQQAEKAAAKARPQTQAWWSRLVRRGKSPAVSAELELNWLMAGVIALRELVAGAEERLGRYKRALNGVVPYVHVDAAPATPDRASQKRRQCYFDR